jgi:hypothetical protein
VERLAAALRENLKRRKNQARAQASQSAEPASAEAPEAAKPGDATAAR